jgi:hypothetical protein
MTESERQATTPDVSNAEADGTREVTALARRSGGPRTLAGKQRSRDNARKHGLLSAVAVLPNESREDYEALREGFREGPDLAKQLRYEAALDRSFDRTLGQLERLQRMRLGQPGMPALTDCRAKWSVAAFEMPGSRTPSSRAFLIVSFGDRLG